jgi:hypothetical protein
MLPGWVPKPECWQPPDLPEGAVLTVRFGALRLAVSVTRDGMDTGPRSLGNYLLADDIVSCAR